MVENLNGVIDYINSNNLIVSGDRIGVGVSGGRDSMALLHFLREQSEEVGFDIIAVHINHGIRSASRKDASFVAKYCKDNDIKLMKFTIDVPSFASAEKIGIEQAARIKRYECFEAAVKKHNLTKFALAHHTGDQAETILLHIFRGSGIAGARGMDARRGIYIRPFLETSKNDIVAYCYKYQIPYVEDETNQDNQYARNFLRNQIIPLLQTEWRNVEKNIIGFGTHCKMDDEYLNSQVSLSNLIFSENNVRIALNYFAYPYSVISRLLLSAFEGIKAKENIEKKHLDLIILLAQTGENGSRVDLPNNLYAIKEYEYITIVRKIETPKVQSHAFRIGKTSFVGFGTITVTKTLTHKLALSHGLMVIDASKLPRTAKWRTRKDGDQFTKFGGGTKPLGAYLIDKKIPARLRDRLPVLAVGNQVLAIAGVEISELVKTDKTTLESFVIEFVKD